MTLSRLVGLVLMMIPCLASIAIIIAERGQRPVGPPSQGTLIMFVALMFVAVAGLMIYAVSPNKSNGNNPRSDAP